MKFCVVLALFAVGIGCSHACNVPLGCGDSVVQAGNAIRSYVTINGQRIIDQLQERVLQLRAAISNGDILAQSALFENVGATGLRNLATTTTNSCLQQVLLLLAEVDSYVGVLLRCVSDPAVAAEISCTTLNYKAQRVSSCFPPPCAVLI